MEDISYIYYECSLLIAKLIPSDIFNGVLFTKFEYNTFWALGEINYEVLKVSKQYILLYFQVYIFVKFCLQYIFISFLQKSYHTYLLVQSEMLHLLAIAYDTNTWINYCQKIPEMELAHIINFLTRKLAIYKAKLSKILNDYDTCKTEPIQYK